MSAQPGDFSHYEQRRLRWIEICRQFPQVEKSIQRELVKLFVYHSNALAGSPVNHATSDAILDGRLSAPSLMQPPAAADASGVRQLAAADEVTENEYWEVKDHEAAVVTMLELAGSDAPIDEALARRLHARLHEHFRPPAAPEKTVSRFPYPHGVSVVPERGGRYPDFAAWEAFAASETLARFHPIKQAARLHHALLDLSPFATGTGKVARLVSNLVLVRHGYPLAVLREDNATLYYYCRRRSARLLVEMIAGALDESFELYYQQVPAKFRPYETRAVDYPADMGRRPRAERRPQAPPGPPA